MRVTDRQLKANRENAKSAGVRTEEGKKTVRQNSFKHGMTAVLLLDTAGLGESEDQYMTLLEGLRESLKPTSFIEESLIEEMAKAQFKLRRFDLAEAKCLSTWMKGGITDFISMRSMEQLQIFIKYKTSLENQFYRALHSLYESRQPKNLDLFGKWGELENSLR